MNHEIDSIFGLIKLRIISGNNLMHVKTALKEQFCCYVD